MTDSMRRRLFGLCSFALAHVLMQPAIRADDVTFEKTIKPILAKYCYECHNQEKASADLDLSPLKTNGQANRAVDVWERALERINDGEMPPDPDNQLSDKEKEQFNTFFRQLPGRKPNCDELASDETQRYYRGYVMSRRLNRREYNNTLRDLVGVDLRPGDLLPADGAGGEGFDNVGDALFTSPILMEKYFDAADLVLDRVLSDGVDEQPPELAEARRRIMIARPSDDLPPRDAARTIVSTFARRAFRRPVTDDEVGRLLSLYDMATNRGDSFDAAVKLSLKGVLVSPHFLFLAEPVPEEDGVYRLENLQLASRLSYYLWSSMPDEELLAAAEAGKLHDDDELRRQTRRMLKHPKSRALGENFALQWLALEELGAARRPDGERFAEFDDELAAAMREEAILFFHDLVREDRSLLRLIDADYTFVNERLARHYGLEGVEGEQMRRVELPDRNRGGVIGMGAVHVVTSFPLRTSPVLRGKWVLESLLGGRVNPPPPEAGELPPDVDTSELSLRQQLELHSTNAQCAGCHRRMDPLGYGMENFDAIGRWRSEEAGEAIDASGQYGRRKFDGPAELKDVLLGQQDQVLKHLARKMFGYAMGRELNRFDECVIDDSIKALSENDHRISALIETIVLSYPFQHRYVKK